MTRSTALAPQPRPAPAAADVPLPRTLDLLAAFASGGLLTLMVLFNGMLALHGSPLFASWTAHGTGTVAAVCALLLLRRRTRKARPPTLPRAPLWAYLGGVAGAVTVMLSSVTVNTALALSGTLALGLAGQVLFSLTADRFGLFGMPRRRPQPRDIGALALILGGSVLIIFFGGDGGA